MEKKISPITERILQYANYKGFSKRKIYIETGISNGVFDKSTGLGENTIEKFISIYTEVNPTWLLTGKGEMLVGGKKYAELHHDTEPKILSEPPIAQNSDLVAYLERKLDEKTRECYDLQAKIEGLASELRRRREAPAEEQPLASVG